jgi:hypothetical protein
MDVPFWKKSSGEAEPVRQDEPVGDGVLERSLRFEVVDFYQEADAMIRLGLASQKSDVSFKTFYRITAAGKGVMAPDNRLLLANARVICDGKLQGLGCSGVVAVTHGLQPSDDGLLLNMRGILDAFSKWQVTCTCGTTFLVHADATVGQPAECYLTVVTILQPESARLRITPFFKTDRVDVLQTA